MAVRSQPTARQVRLGIELRKMREAAGLTAREAAERVGTTSAQMSHVEAGRTGVSEERLRGMATYYACLDDALIDELVAIAAERDKGWWEEYRGTLAHAALDLAELEHRSRRLRTFQGVYIPGLLQVENYTRALMAYGVPQPSTRQLDALVAFRMRRREVLERESPPAYEAVVHEAALRTLVADREVARQQLAFLLEQGERPGVTVRVVPFDAEGFGGAGTPVLYAYGSVPRLDTVHIDVPHGPILLDAESQLTRYRVFLDKALAFSLSAEKSQGFIHTIMRQM
ncbi:DNA-binding protein [Streptomyces malaysiensis]|uniref:DNA-binding protein n=1 Tax=Streptomyces malaysiensis TaxID=92644 RepID=A0A7X5XAN7_STRMQ|nr:DNA-binding protein [Streptomyces malaysiensis]